MKRNNGCSDNTQTVRNSSWKLRMEYCLLDCMAFAADKSPISSKQRLATHRKNMFCRNSDTGHRAPGGGTADVTARG
jgi:hypothetical protein